MNTVLITGANRGIGFELVKQYLAKGWLVNASYRDKNTATALFELEKSYTDRLKLHCLEVTDQQSIDQLAKDLGSTSLDILINNAGIWGEMENRELGLVSVLPWLETFKVNTIAPLIITQTLVNNIVATSRYKLIVNITSKMGSIEDNQVGGKYIYRSSKAALNAVTKSLAVDLKDKGITVIALHPGWVKTDMGGPNALLTPQESVSLIVKLLDKVSIQDTGSFLAFDGKIIPW